MIGLRGFGAVPVGPLAQAQFSGQLDPSFLGTQYFQPSYMPPGSESAIGYAYPTDAFAQALASLLGGSVVQAPPPGNLNGTNIPPADWVRAADGTMIAPGNLFQPGVILSFGDECAAEKYLASSIPGGQLSPTCASGGTGETPTQLAVSQGATPPVTPSGQFTVVGYTPVIPTPRIPVSPQVTIAPSTPVGSGPSNPPAPAPPQSSGSQVLIGNPPITPGGTPPVNPPAAGSQNVTVAACDWKAAFNSSCTGPIDWTTLLTDTDLGIVPNWVWIAGAAAAAIFLPKGGRH